MQLAQLLPEGMKSGRVYFSGLLKGYEAARMVAAYKAAHSNARA